MAKWHGFGRCKTRLSRDIGKLNSSKIQNIMTKHTISVARSVEQKGLINISLAISGLGFNKSRKVIKEKIFPNGNVNKVITNVKLCKRVRIVKAMDGTLLKRQVKGNLVCPDKSLYNQKLFISCSWSAFFMKRNSLSKCNLSFLAKIN